MLNLPTEIEIVSLKQYIAFNRGSNIVDVEIQSKRLKF
nr:hypothetical protein [Dysgonomonas sp. ZJ709]